MKNLEEIKNVVREVLSEAKKKKEKAEKLKYEAKPKEYAYAESFDFSAPLGAYNTYRSQGAVNWGPMTGPGSKVDDNVAVSPDVEHAIRTFVRESIREITDSDSSWNTLAEVFVRRTPENVWEAVSRWYDDKKLGLGNQTEEGIKGKKSAAGKK